MPLCFLPTSSWVCFCRVHQERMQGSFCPLTETERVKILFLRPGIFMFVVWAHFTKLISRKESLTGTLGHVGHLCTHDLCLETRAFSKAWLRMCFRWVGPEPSSSHFNPFTLQMKKIPINSKYFSAIFRLVSGTGWVDHKYFMRIWCHFLSSWLL